MMKLAWAGSFSKDMMWLVISSTSGVVTSFDASNSDSALTVRLERLIPRSFVGRATRSLLLFQHGGLPERAGINFWWIESSSG